MRSRTPEEARAQIEYALTAKRVSLRAARDAAEAAPADAAARRDLDRLREDVARLEMQLRSVGP
ncbi:hypothetical protein M446_5241 [Methylobacterium sp. 4-46]|uniref:hypothetical protein n=1 Tax=unclassified Methylobacterium TaxID=2615210 RepID=UPI000165CB19|nr:MULTISPECIES: hypothetical protein [Methylobacterium]ACA19565.1 hypothetical protein M446_5241 [Methylobacterium sp. 4-46]WFT78760.1 hypothetical protein QA634_26365 [Methylobacterium nodulans]